jgi:hypothetical protein
MRQQEAASGQEAAEIRRGPRRNVGMLGSLPAWDVPPPRVAHGAIPCVAP